jgi:hypothetical protein
MLYGRVSHPVQVHFTFHVVVLQPRCCRNSAGLGSFPFARHYLGNHYYFLFLCLLRCFSSARSRFIASALQQKGCPIQKSRDQFVCADPPGLSQLITSFFASESQGIPRVPFLTFFFQPPFAMVGMLFWFVLRPVHCVLRHEKLTPLYPIITQPNSHLLLSSLLLLPICQRTLRPP